MGRQQRSSTGRKISLSLGLIVISVMYAVWQNLGSGQSAVAQTHIPTPPPIQTLAPAPAPEPKMSMMTQKPAGLYADGSYTGSPADAYYGTVQVLVIVQDAKITDVQFLQHPDSRSNSIRINSEAMPLLTQEAIQAQSANVDGVSGATFTSGAFRESLASALALASAGGGSASGGK